MKLVIEIILYTLVALGIYGTLGYNLNALGVAIVVNCSISYMYNRKEVK